MLSTVGALWKKDYKGEDGKKHVFLAGEINLGLLGRKRISAFKNDKKEKETHPDWRLVMSEEITNDDGKKEYRQNACGALWLREYTDKDGNNKKYFSGVIQVGLSEHSIAIFANENKKEEKHPDYRIVFSKPDRMTPDQSVEEDEFDEDDLPF